MFVDFKCSAMKKKSCDYLNPKENSPFQFSVSNFLSFQNGSNKKVFLWCEWGFNRKDNIRLNMFFRKIRLRSIPI